MSNARQVGVVLHLYANDNRGEIPANYAAGREVHPKTNDPNVGPTTDFRYTINIRLGGVMLLVAPPLGAAKSPYVNSAKIFHCPCDEVHAPYRATPDDFGYQPAWGRGAFALGWRAMSYNYYYVPPGGDIYRHVYGTSNDYQWFRGEYKGLERYNLGQAGAASLAVLSDAYPLPAHATRQWEGGFHGQAWNVLYLDGHVVTVRAADAQATYYAQLATDPMSVGQAKMKSLDGR